jgi:hypothetical protein
LAEQDPTDLGPYLAIIVDLQTEFSERFCDFRRRRMEFCLFSTPFSIDIDDVPADLQMEIIELQCSHVLKQGFKDSGGLLEFYKNYLPKDRFPKLVAHAKKMIVQFGSSYICESVFSRMKLCKNQHRATLTDDHLESTLRLATTNIETDIKKLVKSMQLHDISK